MYYSKTTGGFYSQDIHGENMPADVVEISDEVHAEMLAGQALGKRIVAGQDGAPMLADQPAPTTTELWASHQVQAQVALDASDMVALRCFKAGVAFPSDWLTYVNALRVVVRTSSGDPTQALPTRPAYPSGT